MQHVTVAILTFDLVLVMFHDPITPDDEQMHQPENLLHVTHVRVVTCKGERCVGSRTYLVISPTLSQ